ncbi:MAG: cyclopropane-fatty-acyl-phospholipid synthase family protein [Acidobacteriota bacterium]
MGRRTVTHGPRAGLAASLVVRLLKKIDQGRVRLVYGDWQRTFGDPRAELEGTLIVHDGSFFRDVTLRGEVGLGRAYVAGKWSSPKLEDLALVFHLNIEIFLPLIRGGACLLFATRWLENLTQRWIRGWRTSTPEHSRQGMAVAYDVGNDFFRFMLGENMQYSCAIWASPEQNLEEAQAHKIDLLIGKLDLAPEHSVLEIGCGWGTLLKEIHSRYHCQVRGISLAQKQLDVCRNALPEGRFDYLDYRELEESEAYDRIVSVGMLEHVGPEYIQLFMDTVARLLKPGGRAVLHTMIVGETIDLEPGVHLDSFISRTIMPIACIPTARELLQAINRSGNLHPVHHERFGQHYGKTMREWRKNVQDHREVIADRYSVEHVRVYDYIWGSSSACFTSSNFDLLQLVVDRGPVSNECPVSDPRA